MKTLIPLLLVFALGCEKAEVKPVKEKVIESNERRGGNGNGQGGGNQNTDPCAGYVIYQAQYNPASEWNISVDTTMCGAVVIRWDAQPGFTAYTDPCSPIHGKYLINIQPRPSSCAGSTTTTNAFYYMLGSGCSMFPGKPYTIDISWIQRDTTSQKNIYHISTTKQFTTGTRAPWLNNCN